MAVVMTTKFYEEDTPAWHDLSKVVFTSPNMDSPNSAGIRSHILPGKGDLALWYEDTSNMYEIEPIQDTYDTSFYYYSFTVVSGIDLDSSPTSALITAGNYSNFITFIKEELGVEAIGYSSLNSNIVDETLRLEYTMRVVGGFEVENIYLNNVFNQQKQGWRVEVIDDFLECYIDFEFIEPTNITQIKIEPSYYLQMSPFVYTWYYIGNFKIQAKTDMVGADWVDLYTGANTVPDTKNIFLTSNTDYYTYYRILIFNNDSFGGLPDANFWDEDYYAISGLVFYGYEYSSDPGTGHVILYSFDDDINKRELHIVNATSVAGSPINTEHNTNTDVEGVINLSEFMDGGVLTTRYTIDVDKEDTSTDYHTEAVGDSVSPVISGTTGAQGTTGTITIAEDFAVLDNSTMIAAGETKIENGWILSNLSGQQTNLTYSTPVYDITTNITYTTVVSGTVVSGVGGDVEVTGYTNRYEDRDSAPRSSFYDVSVTDTVGSGTIMADTSLVLWGQKTDLEGVEFSTHDSIVFEITQGEAYDCRLTAWDDSTHSTTLNYLIAGDYVRVSALAFRSEGTVLAPEVSLAPNNYIASPIYNRIFKGNIVYNGVNYYYGDFDLSARTESNMVGDYLIFKPMLYDIDDTVPYGIHDHVITLHYSYT